MLDEVRHGTVGPASQALLEHAHRQAASRGAGDSADDGIKPTRLYSTNRDVDALNERELSQLPGEGRAYEARDQGQGSALRHLQQNCLAPALLQLKLGAQVVRASASFIAWAFCATLQTLQTQRSFPLSKPNRLCCCDGRCC